MDCELLPASITGGGSQSSDPFNFLDETLLEDVTVVVNGQSFLTNRFILSANSFYFRDILNQKPKKSIINVEDIDAMHFASVLNFFGTGQWKDPSSIKLNGMLTTLKSLKLVNYEKVITDYMMKCISIDSFHNVWNIAKQIDQKEAEKEIAKYVATNMEACSKTEDFSLMSLQQVISVLASSDLKVMPPKTILLCVARWCEAALDKRRKYIPSLLTIMGTQFGEEDFGSHFDVRSFIPSNIDDASRSKNSEAQSEQNGNLLPENAESETTIDLIGTPCGGGDSTYCNTPLIPQPCKLADSLHCRVTDSSSTDGVASAASPPCGGGDSEVCDTLLIGPVPSELQVDTSHIPNEDCELNEKSC